MILLDSLNISENIISSAAAANAAAVLTASSNYQNSSTSSTSTTTEAAVNAAVIASINNPQLYAMLSAHQALQWQQQVCKKNYTYIFFWIYNNISFEYNWL